jgi:hypothetical protein
MKMGKVVVQCVQRHKSMDEEEALTDEKPMAHRQTRWMGESPCGLGVVSLCATAVSGGLAGAVDITAEGSVRHPAWKKEETGRMQRRAVAEPSHQQNLHNPHAQPTNPFS